VGSGETICFSHGNQSFIKTTPVGVDQPRLLLYNIVKKMKQSQRAFMLKDTRTSSWLRVPVPLPITGPADGVTDV
jgi:hypothetical protein